MSTQRICLACDLKDNPQLIAKYKEYHASGNTWPAITKSIREAGVEDMQIYLIGNRLFMIMEVNENFDPQKKAAMDAANPKVQEWEELMMQFQQLTPWSKGEKWSPMEKIFQLGD